MPHMYSCYVWSPVGEENPKLHKIKTTDARRSASGKRDFHRPAVFLHGDLSWVKKKIQKQFATHLAYTEHRHWEGLLGCWFSDIPSVIPLTFFLFHSYFELVGTAEEAHLPKEMTKA